MDVSDSVCKSILFSCTDIWTSSPIASSFEISVPQAQLQIVRDQRLVIARKIHAKFKVIEGAHNEPVAMDDTYFFKKIISFDPMIWKSEKKPSFREHLDANFEVNKIAFLMRQTIDNDLVIAHSRNVSKLSEKFNEHERKEMKDFFLAQNSNTIDDLCEICAIDNLEGNRKMILFDFDSVEDSEFSDAHFAACFKMDEHPEFKINEALYNADAIINIQRDLVRDFRKNEASSTFFVVVDCETSEIHTFIPKFVGIPFPNYCNNDEPSCIESTNSGFCASFMTQMAEQNSIKAELPLHPIFVCSAFGTQNYCRFVETCTPSDDTHEDWEDFALSNLVAYPHDSLENIKASAVSDATRSICENIAANLEKSWNPSNSKAEKIGKENWRLSGKRQKKSDSPFSESSKKQCSEVADDKIIAETTKTQVITHCMDTPPHSSAAKGRLAENGETLSESIPSSPLVNQNLANDSQQHTPLGSAVDNPQLESDSVQICTGPKIFVSEMLINQRELYLELEARFSAKSKFEMCETSLEVPDISFSTTSCALVFRNSEIWNNIQNSPSDFPETLQEVFSLLSQAGFKRCMLLLHTQDDSFACPLSWQLKGWIQLLLSNIGIAIDVIQVATICDAADFIYAVAQRDMECFNPDDVAKLRNLTAEQEVIDVLSHVPQLRNPHNLATYAELLTQSDDCLGLFLMDESWRHAALEGTLSEDQLQSVHDCMREVAVQMQQQINHRDDAELEHDICDQPQVHYNPLSGFEQAEGDTAFFASHCEQSDRHFDVPSDALFQVNELPTIKKRRADKGPQWNEADSEHIEQPMMMSHKNADELYNISGTCFAGGDAAGVGKLASTLKYEQRSGNSQCRLAWNVPSKEQRVASVSDIHRQMISPPDFPEVGSQAGWRDDVARALENGGAAKGGSIKGKTERWVPLQNAKDRLVALKRTSLQRDMGKAQISHSWYANPLQQQQQQQQQQISKQTKRMRRPY